MYNFKEKSRYLQDMTNPQYAEADLQLLRQLSPGHALLRTPILRPAKAADKILYALLDVTTVETIRLHRRRSETDKIPPCDPENLTVIGELLADKCSIIKNNNDAHHPDSPAPASAPTEQPEKKVSAPAPEQQNQEQTTDDLQEALKQALSEKESLEEEKEEIISEKEEIEETLEQTQAALDAVQEELETEKKSPEPPSDKKKKSTPTSDGETSSTETSK